jgi:hypothetical protein
LQGEKWTDTSVWLGVPDVRPKRHRHGEQKEVREHWRPRVYVESTALAWVSGDLTDGFDQPRVEWGRRRRDLEEPVVAGNSAQYSVEFFGNSLSSHRGISASSGKSGTFSEISRE